MQCLPFGIGGVEQVSGDTHGYLHAGVDEGTIRSLMLQHRLKERIRRTFGEGVRCHREQRGPCLRACAIERQVGALAVGLVPVDPEISTAQAMLHHVVGQRLL